MRKEDFDHLIAAAAEISGEDEIVVIGSQAILGNVSDPPASLLRSLEADLYPRRNPERAELIEGVLGDGSSFQQTFGFYAHGVGPETARAPAGWQERWVRVTVPRRPGKEGEVYALCIETHDLILAKCVAGRERDWEFAAEALAAGLVELERLLARIDALPIPAAHKDSLRAHLQALA